MFTVSLLHLGKYNEYSYIRIPINGMIDYENVDQISKFEDNSLEIFTSKNSTYFYFRIKIQRTLFKSCCSENNKNARLDR